MVKLYISFAVLAKESFRKNPVNYSRIKIRYLEKEKKKPTN